MIIMIIMIVIAIVIIIIMIISGVHKGGLVKGGLAIDVFLLCNCDTVR